MNQKALFLSEAQVRSKMLKLPVDFFSEAEATGEFEKAWPIQSGTRETVCDVPSEFGGVGGGFSPEDLFLQAVINCFIGTFKVYAKASRVDFSSLRVTGELQVDQNEARKVTMKQVFLKISFYGVERPDRVETLVLKALRDGFILNSVKSEIHHQLEIDGKLREFKT